MLNAHTRISCGPETHVIAPLKRYVGPGLSSWRLRRRLLRGWPDSAVQILSSIKHLGTAVVEQFDVRNSELRGYLQQMPADLATLAAALPDIHRARWNKQRWAEKTPGHLSHVATIRRLFPRAPIIRIVRDPRDVALSLVNMPWGPASLTEAVDQWLKYDDASAAFFDTDLVSLTIRFEDLVPRPVETIELVCDFIGEPFQKAMLDTSKSAEQVNKTGEPWKEKASQPLDSSRIGVWRAHLTDEQQRMVEAMAGDRMIQRGYSVDNQFSYYCDVFPKRRAINDSLADSLAGENFRTWKTRVDEPARLQMFVGDPDRERWFAGGRAKRLLSLWRVVGRVLMSRMHGTPIKWVRDANETTGASRCARIAVRFLNLALGDAGRKGFMENG